MSNLVSIRYDELCDLRKKAAVADEAIEILIRTLRRNAWLLADDKKAAVDVVQRATP